MREVAYYIPGPPVGKGRPRFSRQGHTYTPAKTAAWEKVAKVEASLAMDGAPPMDGPVAVEITATMPVPTSWAKWRRQAAIDGAMRPCVTPDADNLAKAVLDSANGVVFEDDKQAVEVSIVKRYGAVPGVHVRVIPLDVATMERRETAAREAA